MRAASVVESVRWIFVLTLTAPLGCGSSGSGEAPGDEDASAATASAGGALDASGSEDAHGAGSDAATLEDSGPSHPDASTGASHPAADAGTTHASDAGTPSRAMDAADASSSSSAGADGGLPFVIPLITTNDSFFYEANLTIGDQSFFMDIDTGSTTIAVAGHGCQGCAGISPQYIPSSSAVDQDETAMSSYQDGSGWSGEIYEDTVGLQLGTPNVALAFASITSQTQFFEGDAYQGILGLGPPANAEPGTGSYVSLASAAAFPPILAFELCDTSGTLWLGGFDASAASGAPEYTPMLAIDDNNPFYTVNVDDLALGAASLGFATAADFEEPIVDTGTSLLYLPTRIFDKMLSTLNASSGMQALFGTQQLANSGCVQTAGVTDSMVDAQMPSLTLSFPAMTSGAADVTVTSTASRSYLFDNGNGQFCLAVSPGGNSAASTLGITFLRAFVTVVDIQNGRVGFAPDTGCAASGGMRVVGPKAWPPKSRPPRGRI